MNRSAYLPLALAVLLVSFGSIFIRLAIAPPLAVSFYRIGLAALCLRPFAAGTPSGRGRACRVPRALCSCLSGVALALHFATWIASLSSTSIASSVLLVNTAPLFAVGLDLDLPARARALGGPRRHRRRLPGRRPHRLRGLDGLAGIPHRQPARAGGSRHARRVSRHRPRASRGSSPPGLSARSVDDGRHRPRRALRPPSEFPLPATPQGRISSSWLSRSSPRWEATASSITRSAGCLRPPSGSSSSESLSERRSSPISSSARFPERGRSRAESLVLVALAVVLRRSN